MEQTIGLNAAQMDFLQLLAHIKTTEELEELSQVVSDYYAREALEGIPGVLAICAAGPYEQSFADSWSNDLGVWMCDRFSRNLVGHASSNPNGTYRDLYLYCAQHTLGSHVGIYNYENFGNLYTMGPKDFFVHSVRSSR